MNITEISKLLHNKINLAATDEEVFVLSKVIEKLNVGTVNTVATYANLLNIYPQKGQLYFVEDEERLYFGFGTFWFLVTDTAVNSALSWGANGLGQLGDASTTSRLSPVSVVGGFADWAQVSSGGIHTAGARVDGTAWAWGSNGSGRLGDNSITARSSPVSVVGDFTDWVLISAGDSHTAGLRANGTVWAWGYNGSGRLGDNSTTSRRSPVSVVGSFTDWVQISAGYHTVGIRANGTAWAWGGNRYGQVGDNTSGISIRRSSPVLVVGGYTDWVQVSASGVFTAAVRANGTAWCWGNNGTGQLGNNTSGAGTAKSSPVLVVGGFTDWVGISAGGLHTAAVRANGTAWGWGVGSIGELGNNATANQSSPVLVVGGFTDWVSVSAGSQFSVGLRANGTAWGWGAGTNGRLGNNSTNLFSSPVSVVGNITNWIQISAGSNHAIAVRSE